MRAHRWLNHTAASVSAWAAVAVIAATTGCHRPIQIQPEAIEDAKLGVRIKTALVNDPQLGPRAIEVRVTRGVVNLSGFVGSTAEVARAIDLARAVPGVAEVRSELIVRTPSDDRPPADADAILDQPAPTADVEVSASQRRLFAIGASLNARQSTDGNLDAKPTVGFLMRLGSGRGLGFTVGLGWFNADLLAAASSDRLGRITIRPVMAGASYTLTDQTRWSVSLSLVGGMAFNSFTLTETTARDVLALEVDNSAAVRPGVSVWYDLNSRAAFNVFGGYLVTRPRVTFLENGEFARRPLHADTAVLSLGVTYKVF
jgi:hypothetical protein